MFKIFRNNCCGLDVHKTWIYACIGITDPNGRTEYKQARFSSFSKRLRELAAWLTKYSCTEVWSPPASIGALFLTSWKSPVLSPWLIPNIPSLKRGTNRIERMPNGSATYSCAI